MKALLVGGNPRGHRIPFHPKTRSGRILRRLVQETNLDVKYLNLFPNPNAEKRGYVPDKVLWKIAFEGFEEGRTVVALGRVVQAAIKRNHSHFPQALPPILYLPHPACRSKAAMRRLRAGLRAIAQKTRGEWNASSIQEYLTSHPDLVFEKEIRDRGWIDFCTMNEKQSDEFLHWLRKLGYELAEYVDKNSGLLDTVWVNSKHQDRLNRLHALTQEFDKVRKRFRNPKGHIAQLAIECEQALQPERAPSGA